ncbi:uncharacterized protein J4E87_007636 [Alternaria ethzedia]|uniref:uncharacterized protein n=1 Tax=Alternaria ethzedia TaxID=181014 RepID=UPI0020C457E2|nr:uncharacterized protein J4E87_007636 [Alternaria ethzedia]KAI4619386.1 hypothetical protein J4E87_007636 [Alternaria ethzedia]
MVIGFFSSQLVWIRPDFSLAVTGFISATAPEIEDEFWKDAAECSKAIRQESGLPEPCDPDNMASECNWSDGEWVGDDMIYDGPFDDTPEHGVSSGSVKADLFYWATFVWRLMANDFTAISPSRRGPRGGLWEPTYPMEGGHIIEDAPDLSEIMRERERRKLFQQLERARLGHVLFSAWNEQYSTVDEVVHDIELAAADVGITISGDEVDIGKKWEDVFEFKDGRLGFKVRSD